MVHRPSVVGAAPTGGGKSFTDRVENLNSDDVRIAFCDSVQKDFGRLHDLLKYSEDFDGETLAHLEDLSRPGTQYSLPIAFAVVTQVVRDATDYAPSSSTPRLLLETLDHLQSSLSGFGKEREPIQIKRTSQTR